MSDFDNSSYSKRIHANIPKSSLKFCFFNYHNLDSAIACIFYKFFMKEIYKYLYPFHIDHLNNSSSIVEFYEDGVSNELHYSLNKESSIENSVKNSGFSRLLNYICNFITTEDNPDPINNLYKHKDFIKIKFLADIYYKFENFERLTYQELYLVYKNKDKVLQMARSSEYLNLDELDIQTENITEHMVYDILANSFSFQSARTLVVRNLHAQRIGDSSLSIFVKIVNVGLELTTEVMRIASLSNEIVIAYEDTFEGRVWTIYSKDITKYEKIKTAISRVFKIQKEWNKNNFICFITEIPSCIK